MLMEDCTNENLTEFCTGPPQIEYHVDPEIGHGTDDGEEEDIRISCLVTCLVIIGLNLAVYMVTTCRRRRLARRAIASGATKATRQAEGASVSASDGSSTASRTSSTVKFCITSGLSGSESGVELAERASAPASEAGSVPTSEAAPSDMTHSENLSERTVPVSEAALTQSTCLESQWTCSSDFQSNVPSNVASVASTSITSRASSYSIFARALHADDVADAAIASTSAGDEAAAAAAGAAAATAEHIAATDADASTNLEQSINSFLVRHLFRQRMFICCTTFTPFLLHSLFGEFDIIYSLGDISDLRVPVWIVASMATHGLVAAAFPGDEDITSELGLRFIWWPMTAGGLMRSGGAALDLYHSETHISPTCTLVHVLCCAMLVVSWLAFTRATIAGRFSWAVARRVNVAEGSLFLTCALLHRGLGPPSLYAPGNIPFSHALVRSITAIAIGVLLTPANRRRIAAVGAAHIKVELGDLAADRDDSGSHLAADGAIANGAIANGAISDGGSGWRDEGGDSNHDSGSSDEDASAAPAPSAPLAAPSMPHMPLRLSASAVCFYTVGVVGCLVYLPLNSLCGAFFSSQ